MSQPQNLRADELQHLTPLPTVAAVPQTPESSDDLVGQVGIATPRLLAVGGRSAGHTVPATVQYADSMTDGALALRLQAITRLGVVAAPTTLTSLAAFTSAPVQAPAAASADTDRLTIQDAVAAQAEPARDEAAAEEPIADGPKLAVVPADGVTVTGDRPTASEPARGEVPGRKLGVVPAGCGAGAAGERSEAAEPAVPDAQAWASRLVQAVSEVLVGDRPISQLVRFTDDAVFTDLNRRVRLLGLTTTATSRGAKERSAVRSVRVCTPARHVAEVAAHVRHGDRSRAIALRMEIRRHRWVCTALELG